jgi:lysine-N-methylase
MNNIALPKDFNFDDGPKSQNTHLKFYKEFNCIGSDCPLTCCKGWTISLDKKTFYDYKSEDLFKNHITKGVSSGSRTAGNFGTINRKKTGECELLEDNGLCKVQALKGPEALSKTCATFPRTILSFPDRSTHQGISLGCPEAARLCISNENAIELNLEVTQKNQLPVNLHIQTANKINPSRANLFKEAIKFLTGSNDDLWARLVALGATIKQLDDTRSLNRADFSSLLQSSLTATMLEDLDETYAGMFQLETHAHILFRHLSSINKDDLFGKFVHDAADILGEGKIPKNEIFRKYFIAKKFYWKQFSLRYPYIINNIIINDIFNSVGPFNSSKEGLLETIQNIITRTSMIKFLLEVNSAHDDGTFDLTKATLVVSAVQRRFAHNIQMTKQLGIFLKSKSNDPFSLACTLMR